MRFFLPFLLLVCIGCYRSRTVEDPIFPDGSAGGGGGDGGAPICSAHGNRVAVSVNPGGPGDPDRCASTAHFDAVRVTAIAPDVAHAGLRLTVDTCDSGLGTSCPCEFIVGGVGTTLPDGLLVAALGGTKTLDWTPQSFSLLGVCYDTCRQPTSGVIAFDGDPATLSPRSGLAIDVGAPVCGATGSDCTPTTHQVSASFRGGPPIDVAAGATRLGYGPFTLRGVRDLTVGCAAVDGAWLAWYTLGLD